MALDESTHDLINKQAVEFTQVDGVLRSGLGLPQGVDTSFTDRNGVRKSVVDWLGEGGKREDDGGLFQLILGRARYLRHFHDPLETWDQAGLFGVFESSLRWMQNPDQAGQAVGGNWAWRQARDLYYLALTSEGKDDRGRAFADLFRTLGQVMHLVVDASVPEHTRNDPHPLGGIYGNYEYWVAGQHPTREAAVTFIATYLAAPAGPDPALLRAPTADPLAPVPVARLIDTDTYQGLVTSPNVTVQGTPPTLTLSRAVGLAEMVNANFLSEDTAKNNSLNRQYPFPVVAALLFSEHPAPKTGRVRSYYTKAPGDGLPVDPVLAECALDEVDPDSRTVRCTDENVWAQVANAMLPRAAGYSVALLDYFFRGRLEARVGNGTLEVANESDEPLGPGTLALYYDDETKTRHPVAEWPIERLESGAQLSFSASAPPGSAGYVLVYRGALGGEADAVIGQVVQPEPYLFFEQLSYASLAIETVVFPDISVVYWPTAIRITGRLHKSPGVEVLKLEVAPALANAVAYDNVTYDQETQAVTVTIHFSSESEPRPAALRITTNTSVPNPQGFDYPYPNKYSYIQLPGPDDFFPVEGTGSQRATTIYFPLVFPCCWISFPKDHENHYWVYGDFSGGPETPIWFYGNLRLEGTHHLRTGVLTYYFLVPWWEEGPQYLRPTAVLVSYEGTPGDSLPEPKVTVEHYYKYYEEKGPEELKAVLPRSSFSVNLFE